MITMKDMIEDFMKRSIDDMATVLCCTPQTMKDKVKLEDIVDCMDKIDKQWTSFGIELNDWLTGHKLILEYLGEMLIRHYYDVNYIKALMKRLVELLQKNKDSKGMKLRFEQWKLEQMNKDF